MPSKRNIILGTIAALFISTAVFFSFSSPLRAATIEELQQQISSLLKQVQQLQAQLNEQEEETEEWCHTFKRSLRYGNNGSEVRALQTALEKEGIYDGEITGSFKSRTASAVTEFQEKYKKEVLGPWNLEHGRLCRKDHQREAE